MSKRAFITGITGQDGSYLAEYLLKKDYLVFGLCRRNSNCSQNLYRIQHLLSNNKFKLLYGDLLDLSSLIEIIDFVKPDEIYNLAAQSFVKASFSQPIYTLEATGLGVLNMLEAMRKTGNEKAKFLQASSSEMFGEVKETPQKETTPFHPRSPYGCAKVYGYWITLNYREAYNMFTCNSICFNHESPRRGEEFVTKKIVQAVAKIKYGLQDKLLLGNLDAKRDWTYAGDIVEAMHMMLQYNIPDDYIVSSNETHTIKEFLEEAFGYCNLDWNNYVFIDIEYYRPSEVNLLQGDYTKIKNRLGWEPKVRFKELVKMMMQYELNLLKDNIKNKIEYH